MRNKDMSWLSDYVKSVHVKYYFDNELKCQSDIESLDVNDHINQLIDMIYSLPENERYDGWIEVKYLGKRMFIGDGPRYSKESVIKIATIRAEIGQDIYCLCSSNND